MDAIQVPMPVWHDVQALVVQKVDNPIQQLAWFVLSTLIHWIAIYPVDSVTQPLNNWGQMFRAFFIFDAPTIVLATEAR